LSKGVRFEHCLGALALRDYPALARAIWRSPEQYRAALDFIADPPRDCVVQEVAPPRPLATQRTSQAIAALERDYAVGRECGERAAQTWASETAAATGALSAPGRTSRLRASAQRTIPSRGPARVGSPRRSQ
jgi:hypothetical protein